MTVCLVAEVVGFVINFLIWLRTGASQKDGRYKERDPVCLLQTTTWITTITGERGFYYPPGVSPGGKINQVLLGFFLK